MKCRFAVVAAALAVLGLPCLSRAQSTTFTFGGQPNPLTSTSLQTEHCSEMTSWNGIPALNPDGTPNIDNPFPYNMGDICLQIYPSAYTDIDVPWQLGFPNNGFLQQCAPTVWGPLVFDGSGAQNIAGSTATQTFTSSGCYDGDNTTITATVNYVVVSRRFCHYICKTSYANQVTGGSGSVVNEPTP